MQDKNPLAHYSGVLSEAVQESAAVTGKTAPPIAPEFNLKTSAGGRGYVSWYFSNIMQRHDFGNYITKTLAADFACALASWLRDGKPRVESQAEPAVVAAPGERSAFEAWASKAGYSIERWKNDYLLYADQKTDIAWEIWQARAALAATPAAVDVPATERMMQLVDAWFSQMKSGNVISQGIARQRIVMFVDALATATVAAAPVVLPEPAVIATSKRESPVKGSVEFAWGVDALKEEGEHKLFTEQQVRALLATATGLPAQAVHDRHSVAPNIDKWKLVDGDMRESCDGLLTYHADAYREGLADAPQAQADARDAGQEKPPAGRYVLAWMEGKEVPIRAMWVPKSWLAAGDECPEGWAEYDEDKDEYFCPEGWYEANEHEETHWHVGKPIIAWVDLPRYAAIAAAKGE